MLKERRRHVSEHVDPAVPTRKLSTRGRAGLGDARASGGGDASDTAASIVSGLNAQMIAQKQARSPGPADVLTSAARGVQGSGAPIPHLDAIQKSFGRHNVSAVQAFVGGQAKTASDAIGAEAYATGNSVAFRASPTLHTAAHEAAHVVQQRAGVQLMGGVGEVGDRHERHADAVADLVVQGKSAGHLLDQYSGQGSKMGVQRKAASPITAPPVLGIAPKQIGDPAMTEEQKAIGEAFEAQMRVEKKTIAHVLLDRPPVDPPASLKGEFAPLLGVLYTASRAAEAMEILSRVSLKLLKLKPKARRPKNFNRKQVLLKDLPNVLNSVVDATSADTLNELFVIGGGNYSAAIQKRYAAVEALAKAYHKHAVDRDEMVAYMLHSTDTEEDRTVVSGKIAALTMRGDFLLGRMTEGGGELPKEVVKKGENLGTHPYGWEHDQEGNKDIDKGPAIDRIVEPMGGSGGAWCTKTAGVQYGRMGAISQKADGKLNRRERKMFWSNSRLSAGATRGTDVGGQKKDGTKIQPREIVPPKAAMSRSGGGAVYEGSQRQRGGKSTWFVVRDRAASFVQKARAVRNAGGAHINQNAAAALLHPLTDPSAVLTVLGTKDLNSDISTILKHLAPSITQPAPELTAAVQAYLKIIGELPDSRLPPQAGDLLSVGPESHMAGGEKMGGKGSHTVMVEHFDRKTQVIYTMEGNQAVQMTGRAIDLRKPAEYAKGNRALHVYTLARVGVPQYAHANPEEAKKVGQSPDQAAPATGASPGGQPVPKSGAELVAQVTQLNAMLLGIAQHWSWVQTETKGAPLVFNLYTGLDTPKYLGGSVH